MDYYDMKEDETIVFDAGYVIVYDRYGFSKTILPIKDGDEDAIKEMLHSNSDRFITYCNNPLILPT